MAACTLQTLSGFGGIVEMTEADILGDLIPNPNGRTILKVTNNSEADITVSATFQVPCDQGLFHEMDVTVPAGKTYEILFNKRLTDQTTGNVSVTYSDVTNVLVGAYELRF